MTKSILIVGGSGFVGANLALRLREGHKVFATSYSRKTRIPGVTTIPMSFDKPDWIKHVIYSTRPDVVIYVAGNNLLEWAQKDANAREVEKTHVSGPTLVLGAATIVGSRFVYLSNCYAFDGAKGNYKESDTVLPLSTLGKAKVAGENAVKGRAMNYTIVRSSPLFGRSLGGVGNLMDQLRTRLDKGMRLELNTNELHSFAPISGLCELIEKIVDEGPRNKIFHYGGLTKMTHFDFGRKFADAFGYDPGLIVAKKSAAAAESHSTQWGFDYSLNSTHTVESLKIKPLLLEEGFDLIKQGLIV